MKKPVLSIITICIDPNKEILSRFLSSLKQYTTCNYELIIIDNAGKDRETSNFLEEQSTTYIRLEKQKSVAEAWNLGIKNSHGEYVLITNDDIVLPENWFSNMKEGFSMFPKVGIVAPVMNYGLAEQTHIGTIWQKNIACPVILTPFKQIIWGVCMLFTKNSIKEIGGFSEDYTIAGGEDLDTCFKIYKQGFNIVVDHRVFIYHEWGATGRRIYGNDEREQIYQKNYNKFKKKWSKYTQNWR